MILQLELISDFKKCDENLKKIEEVHNAACVDSKKGVVLFGNNDCYLVDLRDNTFNTFHD